MNAERWTRLRDLFTRALEQNQNERVAFLRREAGSDAVLLAELEAMLAAHGSTRLQPFTFRRGRFRDLDLLEEIGSGGMGVVYRARQLSLDRTVAVKVLRDRPGLSGSEVERFREEAVRASKLRHPNIVQIFTVSQPDETPHFVMEHVPGDSLHDLLLEAHERQLAGDVEGFPDLGSSDDSYPGQVASVVASIADALDHAHREGIIHRDVKPSNVILDKSGRACLVDFGIAREAGRPSHTATPVGTLVYMSPEQALLRSTAVDHRTDIYSLGVVAYELLTLHLPFEGDTDEKVYRAIRDHVPSSIRQLNPRVPRDLESICRKAMEKDAADRYATAAEFAQDLRRFLAHESPVARPPSLWRMARQRLRRHRLLTAFSATLIVASIAAVVASTWSTKRAQDALLPRVSLRIANGSGSGATHVYAVLLNPGSGERAPNTPPLDLGAPPLNHRPVSPGCYFLEARDDADRRAELITTLQPGEERDLGDLWLYTNAEVASRKQTTRGADGDRGMVRIPAGLVEVKASLVGIPPESAPPSNRITVVLESFWIDRFEVTNHEYKQFVDATRPPKLPAYWPEDYAAQWNEWIQRGWDLLPVVGIGPFAAEAYARWAGKRLPTHVEWLRAAGGPNGSAYPWGDDRRTGAGFGNTRDPSRPSLELNGWERYLALVKQVGSERGDVSAEGLNDTLGNVREWTALFSRTTQPDARDRGVSREQRIVAGGSCDFPRAPLDDLTLVYIRTHSTEIGFRCARTDH